MDAELEDAVNDCLDRHNVPAADRAIIMEWVGQASITASLLENVKSGAMDIVRLKDGEPMFSLTPQGIKYVEQMLPADLKKKFKK
jgi:siroheme synthase